VIIVKQTEEGEERHLETIFPLNQGI